MGTSSFDRNRGSFTLVVDIVGFLVLLSELPKGFRFRLLCWWNSLLDGGYFKAMDSFILTLWSCKPFSVYLGFSFLHLHLKMRLL
jgi:hypothetical protein